MDSIAILNLLDQVAQTFMATLIFVVLLVALLVGADSLWKFASRTLMRCKGS